MADFERLTMPDSVKTFVAFLGWSRSGNSFLGQVLNAHPNAMIANEGKLYDYVDEDPTRDGVFSYLMNLDRKFGKRGYRKSHAAGDQNLHLPGAFQGVNDDLTVIGNSKARETSRIVSEAPERMEKLLDVLGLEPRFILLTRHPFDIVGSMIKRRGISATEAVDTFGVIARQTEKARNYLAGRFKLQALAYEDFVADPPPPLRALDDMLAFVGLSPSDRLTVAVEQARFKSPEHPGDRYPELAALRGQLEEVIASTPSLSRYRA